MPIKRLPLGEWTPDQGDFAHEGIFRVHGAVSYAGRWFAAPGFVGEDLAGGTSPYQLDEIGGFHIHRSPTSPTAIKVFVGVDDRILRGAAFDDMTVQNATAGALTATIFDTVSGWQFTSYGDSIYACNFGATAADRHLRRALTSTTDFVTLNSILISGGYEPAPRFVSTIKNSLLISHIYQKASVGPFTATTLQPSLVMWSAPGNPIAFGDPTVSASFAGSGYQELNDEHGPITGMVGGDYAYIFKATRVYRMDGPPYGFRPIVEGNGTVYPNSIVRVGNDVYLWSGCGPSKLAYGSSVIEDLGLGKISKTIADSGNYDVASYVSESGIFGNDVALAPIDISGCYSVRTGHVVWFVHEPAGDPTDFKRKTTAFVYDTNTNNFSSFQVAYKFAFAKAVPRYSENPLAVPTASSMSQSAVLDGVFGLLVRSETVAGTVQVGETIGDPGFGNTAAVATADEYPRFRLPYNALEENDGSPLATCITRVKIPFTIRCVPPVSLAGFNDVGLQGSPVKIQVTVRTKSSMSSWRVSKAATAELTLPNSEPDEWIPIDKGEFGQYHSIEFKIISPEPDSNYNRQLAYLRNLSYVDVEYVKEGVGGELPAGAYVGADGEDI